MSNAIDQHDLKALQESMQGVHTAQAVFNSFQAFIASKYSMSEGDSLDITTGVITRMKIQPESKPKKGGR